MLGWSEGRAAGRRECFAPDRSHPWSNRGGRSRMAPGSGSATNPPPCQRWRAVGGSLPSPGHPHGWPGASEWKPQPSRAADQGRPTTATRCCRLPTRGCGTRRCPAPEHPPALAGCHHPSRLPCEMAAAGLEGVGRKGLLQALGKHREARQVQQRVALKKPFMKRNKAGDAAGSLPQDMR